MYCTQCGSSLSDDARFCTMCGAGVRETAADPPPPKIATSKPTVKGGARTGVEEIFVGLCGTVTSLLTAIIFWWIEAQFGVALYSWMFWFIVPVGALLGGFAAASGYYVGSWFFGHRPTGLLLLNVVLASVAAFLLVHYLGYAALQLDGKWASELIGFWQYLDLAIRTTSMEFSVQAAKVGETGELGAWGYGVALLQIIGFAVGGVAVWAYLEAKPYCTVCSRYLSSKGKDTRFTADAEALQSAASRVLHGLSENAVAEAIEEHKNSGSLARKVGDDFRAVFEVRMCKECAQNWIRYTVERQSGNDWNEISELTTSGFTTAVVDLQ